jgi:hypothetical protein
MSTAQGTDVAPLAEEVTGSSPGDCRECRAGGGAREKGQVLRAKCQPGEVGVAYLPAPTASALLQPGSRALPWNWIVVTEKQQGLGCYPCNWLRETQPYLPASPLPLAVAGHSLPPPCCPLPYLISPVRDPRQLDTTHPVSTPALCRARPLPKRIG